VTGFSDVADEYDRIGRQYQESKRLRFRHHVEEHSMFSLCSYLLNYARSRAESYERSSKPSTVCSDPGG
jgi:hypothetical protein